MPAKKLSIEELRKVKSQLAILKKNGQIPKSTDVRKIKPSRHYMDLIRKNQDIVSGSAKGIKVSKNKAEEFKQAGYRVKNQRVVVNVNPGEKASYSHGNVYLNRKLANGEIQRIALPRKYEDFANWVEGETSDPLLEAMKHKDEKFAFRFFGNNSISVFNSWKDVVDEIRKYDTTLRAERNHDARAQSDIVQNIEIVRVKSNRDWVLDTDARTGLNKKERQQKRRAWKRQHGESNKKPGQRGPDKSPRRKRKVIPPIPKSGLDIAEQKLKNAEAAKRYRAKKKGS